MNEQANHLSHDPEKFWDLRLYVAGQTAKSLAAFANLKKVCDEHLAGKYKIEVVDLLVNPQLARGRPNRGNSNAGAKAPRTDSQNHRRFVEYRTCSCRPAIADRCKAVEAEISRTSRDDTPRIHLSQPAEPSPEEYVFDFMSRA